LDAVRAFAMLLGVLYHASLLFVPKNFPVTLAERSIDSLPFVLTQYIHIFRMPCFFLAAGFLGRLLMHRRGTVGFLRNRRDRILIPLVLSWLLICPMMTYMKIWKGTRENAIAATVQISAWRATLAAFTTGQIFRDNHGIPLHYLWFLYELILIYVLVLGLRWMCGRWAGAIRIADVTFKGLLEHWYGAIGMAAPLMVLLCRTRTHFTGLPAPLIARLGVDKPALLAYATFFLIGWFLCRQPDLLGIIERRALRNAAVGIVAGAWPLVLIAHTANQGGMEPSAIENLSYGVAYGLAMVFLSFGFIGFFLRWLSARNNVVRYLSDSSYWIYLAHYPLVIALQVALDPWSAHWSVKIAVITLAALMILLLSYQVLVRHSWVGVLLSGPRKTPQTLKGREYAEAAA